MMIKKLERILRKFGPGGVTGLVRLAQSQDEPFQAWFISVLREPGTPWLRVACIVQDHANDPRYLVVHPGKAYCCGSDEVLYVQECTDPSSLLHWKSVKEAREAWEA